jgi:hypothetical protein
MDSSGRDIALFGKLAIRESKYQGKAKPYQIRSAK